MYLQNILSIFFFKKDTLCKPHINHCSKNCHNLKLILQNILGTTACLLILLEDLWVPLGLKIRYSEPFQAKISESMICGFNDKLFANKFEKGRFSLQYIFFCLQL